MRIIATQRIITNIDNDGYSHTRDSDKKVTIIDNDDAFSLENLNAVINNALAKSLNKDIDKR